MADQTKSWTHKTHEKMGRVQIATFFPAEKEKKTNKQ